MPVSIGVQHPAGGHVAGLVLRSRLGEDGGLGAIAVAWGLGRIGDKCLRSGAAAAVGKIAGGKFVRTAAAAGGGPGSVGG
jgi:hypothetical protein